MALLAGSPEARAGSAALSVLGYAEVCAPHRLLVGMVTSTFSMDGNDIGSRVSAQVRNNTSGPLTFTVRISVPGHPPRTFQHSMRQNQEGWMNFGTVPMTAGGVSLSNLHFTCH